MTFRECERPGCPNTLKWKRSHARYCSAACKQRAYQKRAEA
jgi:hypothetical protein